jgi:hypothetical protein
MNVFMEDQKCSFSNRLEQFVQSSQKAISNEQIRKEYLNLVKEFHPDTNQKTETKTANECMILLNYVFERLMHREPINLIQKDTYEKDKINGKYCYINDYGRKEYVKEKALYIYKLGVLEYNKTYKIMWSNSVFDGRKEESGYEVIGHLYKCCRYLNEVIALDKDGQFANMARTFLPHAYEMNERITRGLKTSNEKGMKKL